jgi:hypothetical protein
MAHAVAVVPVAHQRGVARLVLVFLRERCRRQCEHQERGDQQRDQPDRPHVLHPERCTVNRSFTKTGALITSCDRLRIRVSGQ